MHEGDGQHAALDLHVPPQGQVKEDVNGSTSLGIFHVGRLYVCTVLLAYFTVSTLFAVSNRAAFDKKEIIPGCGHERHSAQPCNQASESTQATALNTPIATAAMFLCFCAHVFSTRVDRATSCTTPSGGAKLLPCDIFVRTGIHVATRPQLLLPVATKPNSPASRHLLGSNWVVLARTSESGPRRSFLRCKEATCACVRPRRPGRYSISGASCDSQ